MADITNMNKLNISRGFEFYPSKLEWDGNGPRQTDAWLEAAARTCEANGIKITLGQGLDSLVLTPDRIRFDLATYDPNTNSQNELHKILRNVGGDSFDGLFQILDDILKDAGHHNGKHFDLRYDMPLAKLLRLGDGNIDTYGPSTTATTNQLVEYGIVQGLNVDSRRRRANGGRVPRNFSESEAVSHIGGLNSRQRASLMNLERGGRRVVDRMRNITEYGFFHLDHTNPEEIDWSRRAHETRMQSPYYTLAVEAGRVEIDENDGRWEPDYGTDLNEDVYYRAFLQGQPNVDLLKKNNISFRHRIRRDNADQIRRVMFQMKHQQGVTKDGDKLAQKIDQRIDGWSVESGDEEGIFGDRAHHQLQRMVQSGELANGDMMVTTESLLNTLVTSGALDISSTDVSMLEMEPAALVQSKRSRFHQRELNLNHTTALRDYATKRLSSFIERLGNDSTIPTDIADKLILSCESALDLSHLAKEFLSTLDNQHEYEEAKRLGQKLFVYEEDPTPAPDLSQSPLVEQQDRSTARLKLKAADFYAMEMSVLHDNIRSLRDELSGANEHDQYLGDAYIDYCREGIASTKNALAILEKLESTGDPNARVDAITSMLEDFALYLEAEESDASLVGLSRDRLLRSFQAIRRGVQHADLATLARQVETSGMMIQSQAFECLRASYGIPKIPRPSFGATAGDANIITFDQVRYFEPEQWAAMSESERSWEEGVFSVEPYHADVVIECQVEWDVIQSYRREEHHQDLLFACLYQAAAKVLSEQHEKGLPLNISSSALSTLMEHNVDSLHHKLKNQWNPESASTWDDENEKALQILGNPEIKETFDQWLIENLPHRVTDLESTSIDPKIANFRSEHARNLEAFVADDKMVDFMLKEVIESTRLMTRMAERKIERELERAGFDQAEWSPSVSSKGETAINELE